MFFRDVVLERSPASILVCLRLHLGWFGHPSSNHVGTDWTSSGSQIVIFGVFWAILAPRFKLACQIGRIGAFHFGGATSRPRTMASVATRSQMPQPSKGKAPERGAPASARPLPLRSTSSPNNFLWTHLRMTVAPTEWLILRGR